MAKPIHKWIQQQQQLRKKNYSSCIKICARACIHIFCAFAFAFICIERTGGTLWIANSSSALLYVYISAGPLSSSSFVVASLLLWYVLVARTLKCCYIATTERHIPPPPHTHTHTCETVCLCVFECVCVCVNAWCVCVRKHKHKCNTKTECWACGVYLRFVRNAIVSQSVSRFVSQISQSARMRDDVDGRHIQAGRQAGTNTSVTLSPFLSFSLCVYAMFASIISLPIVKWKVNKLTNVLHSSSSFTSLFFCFSLLYLSRFDVFALLFIRFDSHIFCCLFVCWFVMCTRSLACATM